ncbi:MAG TPA: hypothetical protein DCR55_11370 [Lentisphaeria bacterium]|nr:hypothetical protein [Lentisphaeria bacterium]
MAQAEPEADEGDRGRLSAEYTSAAVHAEAVEAKTRFPIVERNSHEPAAKCRVPKLHLMTAFSHGRGDERAILSTFPQAPRVDALIIVNLDTPDDLLAEIASDPLPVISIDRPALEHGLPAGSVLDNGLFHMNNLVAPTFLAYARDDKVCTGDKAYEKALREASVSTHIELYEKGGHALAGVNWFPVCETWLQEQKLVGTNGKR